MALYITISPLWVVVFVFSAIRSVSTGNIGTNAGIRRSEVGRNC